MLLFVYPKDRPVDYGDFKVSKNLLAINDIGLGGVGLEEGRGGSMEGIGVRGRVGTGWGGRCAGGEGRSSGRSLRMYMLPKGCFVSSLLLIGAKYLDIFYS